MLGEMAGGFRHIARDRDLVMVAILVCTQTIVAGATVVFGVVLAVDILETGPQGVGIIDSVFGVGAIVGGFYAIARSTRNRLAGDLALGTVLWSLPLLLIVAYPSPVTVFAAAILLGFGNPLVDVNFATIVQRLTPDAVLGRVFGAYEGALIAGMALGSAVTPFLIEQLRAAVDPRDPRSRRGDPGAGLHPALPAARRHAARARGDGPAARHLDLLAAVPGEDRVPGQARSRRRPQPPARPSCARATSPTASWSSSAAGSR